jgi:hypothetical protein
VAALLSDAGLERWQVDDLPSAALDEDEVDDVVNLWGLVFTEISEAGGPAFHFEASEGIAFKIWLKRAVDADTVEEDDDVDEEELVPTDDEAKKKKGAPKAAAKDAETAFEKLAPAVQADLLA